MNWAEQLIQINDVAGKVTARLIHKILTFCKWMFTLEDLYWDSPALNSLLTFSFLENNRLCSIKCTGLYNYCKKILPFLYSPCCINFTVFRFPFINKTYFRLIFWSFRSYRIAIHDIQWTTKFKFLPFYGFIKTYRMVNKDSTENAFPTYPIIIYSMVYCYVLVLWHL